MLSWELHATFVELHPLRSITPDQSGCIVTDEVHDSINNKRQRDTCQVHPAPVNRPDTSYHFTDPWPLTWSSPTRSRHQAAMMLVPKWCYTT